MDWTAQAIEQLRALWAEGHSTAEIGRRMGVSKNAIVGKAHRLNLSARPSPIRRDASAAPRPAPQPRRVAAPALPPMLRQPMPIRRPEPPVAAPRPVAVAPPPPRASVVRAFPRASNRNCCWPIGEPGTPEFRFCTAEATSGKPYCQEHAAVAYVRVRDRREDAA
jgi:GcrA cell cycle regulator